MVRVESSPHTLTVTEVEIYPVRPRGGLVAFASCVVNGCLYLGKIGIHTRPDGSGYRLVFPIKVLPNGKQLQCVHPVNQETGNLLLQAIVRKFEALATSAQRDEDLGDNNGDDKRIP